MRRGRTAHQPLRVVAVLHTLLGSSLLDDDPRCRFVLRHRTTSLHGYPQCRSAGPFAPPRDSPRPPPRLLDGFVEKVCDDPVAQLQAGPASVSGIELQTGNGPLLRPVDQEVLRPPDREPGDALPGRLADRQ